MAADRIQIADVAPPHCSGCFQQKPEQQHVDLGAAWDGPMLPALDGAIGVVGHAIDELVLCADCVRAAGKLLGLADPGVVVAERDQLEAAARTLREKNAGLESYVANLEAAIAAKPGGTAPVKPITFHDPAAQRAPTPRRRRSK